MIRANRTAREAKMGCASERPVDEQARLKALTRRLSAFPLEKIPNMLEQTVHRRRFFKEIDSERFKVLAGILGHVTAENQYLQVRLLL
jgi:hypothetical protein